MKDIKVLCQEQGYNAETTAYLDGVWQKIKADEAAYAVFADQIEIYKNNMTVQALGEPYGFLPATMDLLLLIQMLPILREQYVLQDIPMKYYDAIVNSFRGHAERTLESKGVATAGVAWWSMAYFKLKMFSIGRLIYKWRPFRETFTVGDYVIEEGVYHIDVHIPSSGSFAPEVVHASYDEARAFFEKRYNQKGLLFGCSSWLMSPTLDEMLPPTSNILAFAHEYTILKTSVDETGEKTGHYVFGSGVDMTNVDALPENSSLQRAMKARLKEGKGIGHAFGVILPKK